MSYGLRLIISSPIGCKHGLSKYYPSAQTTNDLSTSHDGFVRIAKLMLSLNFSDRNGCHFPVLGSNLGFKPSTLVDSLILMLHDGGQCLDDLRHLPNDDALQVLLGLNDVTRADSTGNWLRRLGQLGLAAVAEINRTLLRAGLHHRHSVTLDTNATQISSAKRDAKYI